MKFISKDYAAREEPPKSPREIDDDMVWPIVDAFFQENGLLRHQLEPCNEGYLSTIRRIILENREFAAEVEGEKYTVEFGELVFERPVHKENSDEIRAVTPLECINRDITYKSDMLIDVEVTNPQGFRQRHSKIHFGSVPVMVKSELCNLYPIRNDKKRLAELREDLYDAGGYFIVKGMPKIIASQERSAFNTCYSFKNKKTIPKYIAYTEVRSCSLTGAHSTVVQVGIMKNGIINVVVPYIDMSTIPMGVLFQALGSGDELDMVRYIEPNITDVKLLSLLVPSFEQSRVCVGQADALYYIGRRGKKFMSNKSKSKSEESKSEPKTKEEIEEERTRQEKIRTDAISYASHLLSVEFLPHLGTGPESFVKKRFYLGYMINKFLLVHLGRRPVEDRDHFLNKRPAVAGQLLCQQFFSAFRRLRNEIINGIERNLRNNAVINVPTLINPKIITTSLMSALSNNAWGSRGKVSGVSQNYDRFNSLAAFSNARKIITPMNADGGKVMAPRGQNASQAYIVCVAGDTKVTLADNRVKRIDKLGQSPVMTVDPITLENEPSGIHNNIRLTPDSVLRIEDDCGRVIKCTPDHPFLTGKLKWKKAGELKTGDAVVVVPRTKVSPGKKSLKLPLSSDVLKDAETAASGLAGPIDEIKAGVLARLMGSLFTDGSAGARCEFYLGELQDALQVQGDIFSLGYGEACIRRKEAVRRDDVNVERAAHRSTYHVVKGGAFNRLMKCLGAPVGAKKKQKLRTPEWIMSAPRYVKKEWLSGVQGGDGSELSLPENVDQFKICINPTQVASDVGAEEFIEELAECFREFNIESEGGREENVYQLHFGHSRGNLYEYSKVIDYAYCDRKQRASAITREYLKNWNAAAEKKDRPRIKVGEAREFSEDLGVTPKQYREIRGGRQKPEYNIKREDFRDRSLSGGKCLTKIVSIEDSEIEDVYDFTTVSPNHSFIANDYVTHNCPAETPEGKKCLVSRTPILTPDRGLVEIGKLKNNDRVITINPKTLQSSITTITDHFIDLRTVYSVQTLCGFRIAATKDHPFLCDRGWKEINQLSIGDSVTIKYIPPSKYSRDCIWARILGFSFAGAGVYRARDTLMWSGSFGCRDDAEEFMNDLDLLGFERAAISERDTAMESDGGRIITRHTFIVQKGGIFCGRLRSLGAPIGNKAVQPLSIPDWIVNGAEDIQKEFVAGFQGGGGGCVSWLKREGGKNAHSIAFGGASLRTKFPNETSVFMTHIRNIMDKCGISTRQIRVSASRYDSEMRTVLLPMSNSAESIVAYMDNIGYRYCRKKTGRTAKVWFYMKYKLDEWEKRKEFKEKVAREHRLGVKSADALPPGDVDTIDQFLNNRWIGEGCCSLPIMEIRRREKKEEVADFTTISDNHSFIADGFITHNCGLVKTMALTALITVGSQPDALLEIMGVSPSKTGLMKIIPFDVVSQSSGQILGLPRIFVNGDQIGVTRFPREITNELRHLRRSGNLNPEISIAHNILHNQINISTEQGRICRPLFIVEKGKVLLKRHHLRSIKEGKWDEPSVFINLLDKGLVELIDKSEEESAYIVSYPSQLEGLSGEARMQVTHCELHPSLMYGSGASVIPYLDHNQSPRNTYQCLWEEEEVLMANGTRKKIKNIEVGDEVITFNPGTCSQSYTKVTHVLSALTDKKMYEVVTTSGRKIKATSDHKFMTSEGWKKLEDISVTDMKDCDGSPLLGISLEPAPMDHEVSLKKILTIENFIAACIDKGISERCAKKYASELEKIDLLPLTENSKLPVLSRLFGFFLAAAPARASESGVVSCEADFGDEESRRLFIQDLEYLGFEDFRLGRDGGSKGSGSACKVRKDGAFPALLVALGRSAGKRGGNSYHIPTWVAEGSRSVKREFLSGFQGGGDGGGISWERDSNKKIRYWIDGTIKTAALEYAPDLSGFMENVMKLLREFGIEVAALNSYVDRRGNAVVGYNISSKKQNMIRYFDNIGYRYDVRKSSKSAVVVEYRKYMKLSRDSRRCLVDSARELRSEGKKVSEMPGLDLKEVRGALGPKRETISLPRLKEEQTIEHWSRVVKISPSKTTIFVPVGKKKAITGYENISDITTESRNHCFVTGGGFCVHNSSMGKQAVGIPSTNFAFQRKGNIHVLDYAEHPIVYSKAAKYSGIMALPTVQNASVFVGQWYGFNQEDSIIMNQSSIDRGFMCSTVYMGFEGKVRSHLNEEFEVPLDTECNNFKGNTSKLDKITGIIQEGAEVEDGDVLIGRTVKVDSLPTIHQKKKNNISVIYKHMLPGRVHAVDRGINGDGYEYYRVVVAHKREPILGDKFASVHGQKGTVGAKYRAEDMPHTETGEVPDIIINPLAFPSRMTIAMLIEMLSGIKVTASSQLNQIEVGKPYGGSEGDPSEGRDDKKKCKTPEGGYGKFKGNRDATPFDKSYSLDRITKEIKKLGIAGFSEVLCYHPYTGLPQKVLTFKGNCSYQKLRHMVLEKIHSRSRGARTLLTRQPKEGRKVGGGFRVGHMERDCLLANGCPAFVRDRLMEQSDEYRMHYCKVCGLPATVVKGNPQEDIPESKECKVCQSTDIAYIRLPYATKLLMFEFIGMGIVFRVLTDPYEEPTLEPVKGCPDPKIAKKLKKVYEPVVDEMTKALGGGNAKKKKSKK